MNGFAKRDTNFVAVNDSTYNYEIETRKKSFGRRKVTESESFRTTNVGSDITAGGNVTVNSAIDNEGAVALQQSRNLLIQGSDVKAGGDLVLAAGQDIQVTAGVEEQGDYQHTSKSGFLGISGRSDRELDTQTRQVASELTADNDAIVVSGRDTGLAASRISAGNDIDIQAGVIDETGDIHLEALTNEDFHEEEHTKKSFSLSLSDNFLSWSEENKQTTGETTQTSVGSELTAANDLTADAAQDISVVGSLVSAGNNLSLNAGRDINVDAAHTVSTLSASDEVTRSGMSLEGDDNGVTFFSGDKSVEQAQGNTVNQAAGSLLHAGNDLNVHAGNDLNVHAGDDLTIAGSDVVGQRDVRLTAVNDVDITSSRNVTDNTTKQSTTLDGLTLRANHNIGQAIDAISNIGGGDNAVSDASSVMRAADAINNVAPSASAHLGQTTTTVEDTLNSDEARGASVRRDLWVQGGGTTTVSGSQMTAARDITVLGKDVDIQAADNTYTTNTSTDYLQVGVTLTASSNNASLTAGFSSQESDLDTKNVTNTASALEAGQDLTVVAENNLTVTGSDLNAARDIDLVGGHNVDIRAAEGLQSSNFDSEHLSAAAGINFGANGIGVTASAAAGENDLDRTTTTHRNSHINAAGNLSVTSGNDTNVLGGNLHGNTLDLNVGNDLHLASVQDVGSVEGKRWDVSANITVGAGVSGGASVGYGETEGSSAWVQEQSTITGSESVNISVGGHTQIDGAVIANIQEDGTDGGNLVIDTGTLGFSDIEDHHEETSSYLSVGFSTGGSGGANANTAAPQGQEDSSWSLEAGYSDLEREQINRATVGEGTITVREDAQTGNDSTAGLNRDIAMAREVTKDDETNVDVYVTSTAIDALSNLTTPDDPDTPEQENTLRRWGDSITSVADPDAWQSVIDNGNTMVQRTGRVIQAMGTNLDADLAET